MLATVAGIEVLVGVASQIAKAFHLVLHGMAVHNVHYHRYAFLMCGVDELLQFLRCAEAA